MRLTLPLALAAWLLPAAALADIPLDRGGSRGATLEDDGDVRGARWGQASGCQSGGARRRVAAVRFSFGGGAFEL